MPLMRWQLERRDQRKASLYRFREDSCAAFLAITGSEALDSARKSGEMRILLVEDEPDLGNAIKRTLNHDAYIVDWVLNGTEAWSYLENSWTE